VSGPWQLPQVFLLFHSKYESEMSSMERPHVVLRLLELEMRCCPTSLAVLGSAGINMLDMGQSAQAPKPLFV
jgi:hypothetical protein